MWSKEIFGIELYSVFYNFFIYAFCGWLYESSYVSLRKKSWINRGFLNGPVIPIYGVGATLVYIAFWQFRGEPIIVFIGGMILATLLEYFTSWIMEVLFHSRWWDYSNIKFNINGRVCLPVSLFWGILSIIMTEFLQPNVVRILNYIPEREGGYTAYIILLLFSADISITVIHTKQLDSVLADLQRLKQEFSDYIENSRIYETKEELKRRLSSYKLSELFDSIRLFMEENSDKLVERNRMKEGFEIKRFRLDVEKHVRDYAGRLQSRVSKMSYVQKRLLRAFPDIKSVRYELELKELKKRMPKINLKKEYASMSSLFDENLSGTYKSYLSGFLRAALVGILVLIQFALLFLLTYWLSASTIYFYLLIEIGSIFVTIGLVNDYRSPSYKIGWICVVLILPLTGHIMYALWGKSDSKKKIEKKIQAKFIHGDKYLSNDPIIAKELEEKHPTKSRMSRYMETLGFPLYRDNEITYYPMGEDTFEAIFQDIKKAEKFIFINFFIVAEGTLWDNMHKILSEKLKEGVKIRFMYDDFGAMLRTSNNFKKNLEAEGFEIAVFNPIHKYTDKLYMNYRSHQKIIVIDGNIGYTGGMNLADEYVNLVRRFGTWKDNAVRVEGNAVWGLTVTFLKMWEISTNTGLIDYNEYRPTKVFPANDVYCHVIADGPVNNPSNPIESIYMQIINYAKKYVYITTPYLIIEDGMKDALITAVKSGVDVRIITPYIPDKKNVKILTNYNYGQLLEAGIKIYEYKPGFIHAKTIINEDCGIVGTVNMDYRSFYLHYECGLWMCNNEVIDVIKEDLIKTMEESMEISYQAWKNRPWHIKTYQRVLNLFSTLM